MNFMIFTDKNPQYSADLEKPLLFWKWQIGRCRKEIGKFFQ
jgi:hypothetical protein